MISCCASLGGTGRRRARPLLGTYVEIFAAGRDEPCLDASIDRAFEAVATVHRLMSFQEPDSELSRLNRGEDPTGFHSWTREVLALAADLKACSHGAFDPQAKDGIDLSGIAKGFAVDRAIEALKAAGIAGGTVNAGGDLAVFGGDESEVGVRNPADPSRLVALVRLNNQAFASSGRAIDPATRRAVRSNDGASVRAPCCTLADALTKVVSVAEEKAVPLLRRFSASALLFRDGGLVLLAD
jgi:thiamine biosynthesis lipoprotein